MFPFYLPRKHQKTKGFLVFSGGIIWEYWPEMGYKYCLTAQNYSSQQFD